MKLSSGVHVYSAFLGCLKKGQFLDQYILLFIICLFIFIYIDLDSACLLCFRNELHSCFGSLYFIPDIPELNEVHAILRNYLVAPVSADTFHLQLQQFIVGLKNDNVEVNKQVCILYIKLVLIVFLEVASLFDPAGSYA